MKIKYYISTSGRRLIEVKTYKKDGGHFYVRELKQGNNGITYRCNFCEWTYRKTPVAFKRIPLYELKKVLTACQEIPQKDAIDFIEGEEIKVTVTKPFMIEALNRTIKAIETTDKLSPKDSGFKELHYLYNSHYNSYRDYKNYRSALYKDSQFGDIHSCLKITYSRSGYTELCFNRDDIPFLLSSLRQLSKHIEKFL